MIDDKQIINIIIEQASASDGKLNSTDKIDGSTYLIKDLGFSSVEFVVIFERIQAQVNDRINFIDLLMPNRSSYVDDLSISQIISFLRKNPTHENSSVSTDDPYINRRELIETEDINLLEHSIRHQEYPEEQVNTSSQLCFLLSAPRSGSTLLRKMIGCHPDVYAPMELHLMSYINFKQRREELGNQEHRHLLEGTIVARQEVRGMKRSISEAVEEMYVRDERSVCQFYREIDQHLSEKVLVDKTPTYAFSSNTLERIKRTFPQAKFIHLTRTPNAVIKSMIDSELGQLIRFQKTSGIKPNRFAEALWCLCERNIRNALKDANDRTMNINYEALVTDPESTMKKLHEFLGITESTEFDPYSNQSENSQEQVSNFAGDLKTYLRSSIDSKVAFEWKNFDSLNWLSPPTKNLFSVSD